MLSVLPCDVRLELKTFILTGVVARYGLAFDIRSGPRSKYQAEGRCADEVLPRRCVGYSLSMYALLTINHRVLSRINNTLQNAGRYLP